MFFFIFAISMLVFSGWWFFKNVSAAGKHIEAKVAAAGIGVALFFMLVEVIPKVFSGILKTDTFNVYDEPYSYIFFLACGGVVYGAGRGLARALKNAPPDFLSDAGNAATASGVPGTMDMFDRTVRAIAMVFLIAGGIGGGLSRWAGEADMLPFLMFLVTLPALGVWFGRRSATLKQAVIRGAIFGAAFILPSFLFYWSRNFGSNLTALLFSILSPALCAAVAFSARGTAITASSDEAHLKSRADNIKIGSFIGIILPQFFQPAVFDEVRTFHRVAKEKGDEKIGEMVSLANIISYIMLGLTILSSALAIIIAVLDAM